MTTQSSARKSQANTRWNNHSAEMTTASVTMTSA